MTGHRVGVDVGGTFTDLVCITPDGQVVVDKVPTTPDDQSVGVLAGVAQLAGRLGLDTADLCGRLDTFVHGTTVADNTMIQMSGPPTGLLVTEGHRDEIELRRVHKEEIWDPTYPPPPPIARRRARIPIPERVDVDGNVLVPLDEEAVRRGVRRLRALGIRSIAVLFLHSFTDAAHERRARELILEEFPEVDHVSLSHEVMPRAPEFERTSTTLVNAYVAPAIAGYVDRLAAGLGQAGFDRQMLIMQATGGVMPPDYVARNAVSLLGSGPTGGVMGATLAAARSTGSVAASDVVTVDMGGTSYDVCLVRGGQPQVQTDWNWRYRYYIGLPMVDVRSVGAGGGSIASVHQGALLVGPASAGSDPGPACYRLGGTAPTVTDADLLLGYLPTDRFAAGRVHLDTDAAAAAVERDVARPLGIDVVDAAWGIERIVNSTMGDAVRRVLASHGADPRELTLVAYGGNGPVHAWAQASELGIRRILVPKAAPALSALGLLTADYRIDEVRAYVAPLSQVDIGRLRQLLDGLADHAAKELTPAGLGPADVTIERFVQMCYPGQNADLSVTVPEVLTAADHVADVAEIGLMGLAHRFHDRHEADRGYAFRQQQPLVRGVRLIATGRTAKPERLAVTGPVADAAQARIGVRRAHFGDGFVDAPVYDGPELGPGAEVVGPALVDEPFTVVVLPPGFVARLDEHGTYDIAVP
ncbi:MAG: hydantoinase/oxoprolinase family protein [Acidimicrobiales bacterium]